MKSPCRRLWFALALLTWPVDPVLAFLPSAPRQNIGLNPMVERQPTTSRAAVSNSDDAFDSRVLVQRARAALEKSKAKLALAEGSSSSTPTQNTAAPGTPFFAERSVNRDRVVKSIDVNTGLITADGEVMAAISEQEDWEMRSLAEVFDNEMSENGDVYSAASQQLAERDLAASVFNLRKHLQTEDFLKIFDKRNFFIGETD